MLNGVNQSSFRSFRGFKENICARFFLQPIWELRAHPRPCKDAANTSSVLRRWLLSLTVCKHIIQSQTCPLLPAFLSLFRSLPFKIWLKLFFLLWACDLLQRRPVALFFEGTSGQNAACGEFCRRRRRSLNDKKGSISEKGFPWQKYLQKRVSVAEIFAKLQVWDEKLRQMHEIGKRVGIRRKRRSTEWNIFTVEDLANSRTGIKKKGKIAPLATNIWAWQKF